MINNQIALLDFIDKMEQMSQFQDKLDISSTTNQIWEVFLEELRNYITIDVCALFLVDEKTHEFALEKATPQHMEDVCNQEVAYQIECNMFSWIINRRKPAIIPSFYFKEEKTIIMLPLSTVKRTMGVILALTPITESMITQENLKLLSMLARQCSLVMENSMLYSRVRKKHDALQKAQAKLIQSEKLASIGRLTAGASHEILNPLSIISGHIQLLSMKHEFEPGIQKPLDAIKTQTDRIGNIIKGLAQFSRYFASDKKWIGINEVIRKFIETANGKEKKQFQIQRELDSSNPKIMGSKKSLTHLLSFLLSNAVDAIDDNGTITIKTYLTNSHEGRDRPGEYGVIEFADNGCGISKPYISRVFEPFFTTKKSDYKTGLGLSLAYSIVQDHGGRIEITSEPNIGTSVLIYFPVKKS